MFKRLWNFLCGWFEPVYRVAHVAEKPDTLNSHTVYLVGEENDYWAAVFICPCGCRADVWLNLLRHDERPTWTVESKPGDKAHIQPSVWRNTGCRSHFFIKNGRLTWAGS